MPGFAAPNWKEVALFGAAGVPPAAAKLKPPTAGAGAGVVAAAGAGAPPKGLPGVVAGAGVAVPKENAGAGAAEGVLAGVGATVVPKAAFGAAGAGAGAPKENEGLERFFPPSPPVGARPSSGFMRGGRSGTLVFVVVVVAVPKCPPLVEGASLVLAAPKAKGFGVVVDVAGVRDVVGCDGVSLVAGGLLFGVVVAEEPKVKVVG